MTTNHCSECARLEQEVDRVLEKLVYLTNAQLSAFQTRNDAEFTRLDKELELTMFEKERKLGAMREHIKQHSL